MLKKVNLLFSLLLPISIFSYEIVDYKPDHKQAILEISFQNPEFFFPFYKQCKQSPIFNKAMFSDTVKASLDHAKKKTLVLIEDGLVAGFVTFFKTKEQCIEDLKQNPQLSHLSVEQLKKNIPGIKDTKEECRPFAKIESVAVSKDFRRRGFGTLLLQKIFDYIQAEWPDIEDVVLDVVSDNEPAQSLYVKFGFVQSEQNDSQKMMNIFGYRKDLK